MTEGHAAATETASVESWRHPWVDGIVDNQPFLFIVGSYRCGTTSIFNYFSCHPDLRPCVIKEPGFFFSERWAAEPSFYPTGDEVAAYLSMFRGTNPEGLRMEATSNYLHDAGCAQRIIQAFPSARIVITLRDPIARLLSWYRFLQMQGWLSEQRSIESWLEAQWEDERTCDERPYPLRALQHGLYSHYLKDFVAVFGQRQLRVVWQDEIRHSPRQLMRELAQFAGVNPDYFRDASLSVNNPAQRIRWRKLFRAYRRVQGLAFGLLRPFPWTTFRLRNWFFGQVEPWLLQPLLAPARPVQLPAEWERRLCTYYAADVAPLTQLVGRDPPWASRLRAERAPT